MQHPSGSDPNESLSVLSLEHVTLCLNAVANLATLLQSPEQNPDPSIVENIRRSARNLTVVNKQFEDLWQQDGPKTSRDFVPKDLIEFQLQAWQTYAVTQGIFLAWTFERLPSSAQGDPQPLHRLLLRFLSELFASRVQGTVELTFDARSTDSGVHLVWQGPMEVLATCQSLAESLGGSWTGKALEIPLPGTFEVAAAETAPPLAGSSGELPPAIALEHLAEISGGDQDFERELLTTFVQDIEERVPVLQNAVKPFDGEKLRTTAHSIAGSASCIGAQVFREKALALEYCGRDGIAVEAPGHLQAFEDELARVKDFLTIYFAD